MDNGAKKHQVELSDLEIIIVMFALALHKILFDNKFLRDRGAVLFESEVNELLDRLDTELEDE